MICSSCYQPLTLATVANSGQDKSPLPSGAHPPGRLPGASGHRIAPRSPRQGGPGGVVWFLLVLLLIAGGAFGYAMYRFDESPRHVWKRVIDGLVGLARPEPAPVSVPEPAPEAEPAPAPEAAAPQVPASVEIKPEFPPEVPKAIPSSPEPEPEAAQAAVNEAAPDPLVWLCAHRESWPRKVALMVATPFEVFTDGVSSGVLQAVPGVMLDVVKIEPGYVTATFGKTSKKLPADSTDLAQRAAMAMRFVMSRGGSAVPPAIERQSAAVPSKALASFDQPFRHPGVVLTAAQLDEIRNGVRSGREPWKSWFAPFDYDPGTVGHEGQFEEYGRNGDIHRGEFQSEMWELHRMAMLWVVKKDRRAAERGVGILENYAKNHKRFVGVEGSFMQGDCMNAIIAAEILRSTYPGWTEQNTANIKRYFSEVWWQQIRIGKDNTGAGSHFWTANQGTIGLKAALATAIFCDDRARFNMCLNAYLTDPLTGLESSTTNGQVGDTGRDSGHWTAQCIDDGWICQMAWAQGIDLFAQRNNRIVAISEFLAQTQLFWGKVITQKPAYIPYGCAYEFDYEPARFDDFRGYDFFQVINAYADLKRLPAPFTRQLLDHQNHKPVFTLDDSIPTQPIALPWVQPPVAPVAGLRSTEVGASRGSSSGSEGVWRLESDSKRMEDGYRFAYVEAKGDWTFIARVTQGGAIIATERLEPTRQVHAVWLDARKEGSAVLYSHGQQSYLWPWDMKYYGGTTLPMWLKLVRRGVFIQAYRSVDGVNWAGAANVRFDGLGDKFYVGIAACVEPAKFDHVAFGSAPSSLPLAPTEVQASARINQVELRWKPGANTVFCNVLRAETADGPYRTVAERLTTNQFTDTIQRGKTEYHYVISPAGYSGYGPNSKEVVVH